MQWFVPMRVNAMEKATKFPPNERLKAYRIRRTWSQEDLAEKVGTSSKNVGRWERGETFPSPYYRRKLCEVFDLSPGELGLLPEDPVLRLSLNSDAEAAGHGQPFFTKTFLPKHSSWRVALAILWLLVVVAGVFGLSRLIAPPVRAHIVPGGSWISPMNGQTISGIVHFAAYAYPTNLGDPAIDHVNFTMWWQGVDPRKWVIACALRVQSSKDIYSCDVNLAKLGAVAGPIKISFDVYDRKGNSDLAPNGVHTITYSP
jgi:transcriptional regulator with XRE-family HTH domain